MRKLVSVFALVATAGAFVALYASSAQGEHGGGHDRRVYSAKFLCGKHEEMGGPVLPGEYETAINVHNPNDKAVTGGKDGVDFRKKAVLLWPPMSSEEGTEREGFEQPQPPGPFVTPPTLEPNWGFEIDCPDIREVLLAEDPRAEAPFIKGYVVIEARSKVSLDVVAAYTTHGLDDDCDDATSEGPCPEGFSIDVETVVGKGI